MVHDAPPSTAEDPTQTTRDIKPSEAGYWVFEVDESYDLYSYFYASHDAALRHVEDTENKCQILCVEPVGSNHIVRVDDHT